MAFPRKCDLEPATQISVAEFLHDANIVEPLAYHVMYTCACESSCYPCVLTKGDYSFILYYHSNLMGDLESTYC